MRVKGITKAINELKKYGKQAQEDIAVLTEEIAEEIQREAATTARAKGVFDTGALIRDIFYQKQSTYNWVIYVGGTAQKYAPYMEYGTGGKVQVPNEMKDNAIQFIGKGVKEINIMPRPFLYPAFVKHRVIYINELEKLLKKYGNVNKSK